EAEPLCVDLTEPTAAEQIFEYCEQHAIEVDTLVNNAGMLIFNQLERTDSARIEAIIALHCTTPTKLCRLFAPVMRERGGGHIVLMSSVTAWTPFPTISHYAATKSYLRSFGQSLWYEMRGSGVTVTTVFPSAVDTPFYSLGEGARRWLRRLGIMQTADEVARRALRAARRGRRRCFPSLLTKIEVAICYLLPSWVLLPVLRIPAVRRILERI
ncbi:MAG: SDR family NAD(P)-dependent oxidoreductase, partial [Rikenellaceae bacterium]|nr:SDR family NAD(P)-dependent oxidoreductase [Rikenellaceae bacterium]